MIAFCEDCGKKNPLNSLEFIAGKPAFRCAACGCLSPYHFNPREALILDQADGFFEESRAFPEILGSFLFHRELGVLKNHMPGLLKPSDLDFLGRHLADIYGSCQSGLDRVNEMALCVADKHMIVRILGENLFLTIACTAPDLPRDLSANFSHPPPGACGKAGHHAG
nr:hypothetical protein [Desulfobacula sp.]